MALRWQYHFFGRKDGLLSILKEEKDYQYNDIFMN
jgi:hypothetical protein